MHVRPPQRRSHTVGSRRFGLLSTYPPELCGLATFAAALERGLRRGGDQVDVVRIGVGAPGAARAPHVVGVLHNNCPESVRDVAALLSRCDVAILQHEYGIFGGADGAEIIDLLHLIDVPTIVTLHTVPLEPTPHQRELLIKIVELAGCVVVMTQAASDRLVSRYPVDERKVVTIPHGASTPTLDTVDTSAAPLGPRPQLLTWGLLGPGKGIEHTIDALSLLTDIDPTPRYTVAGVTHPKVFANHGDRYRRSLIDRARTKAVESSVTFDDTYRDLAQLTRFVASATAIVLPYDSRDQVTSGVLVDAIAAGRPVIATAFPHAIELLGSGAGIVVPHGDPVALAAAIRVMVTDVDAITAMAAEARRIAPSLSWSAVADQYALLADDLVRDTDRVAI